MTRKESPLEVVAKGAVSGLVGTVVITVAMKLMPVIMQQLDASQSKPQAGAQNKQASEDPTENLAEKVSEGVFEKPVDHDKKQAAGQAIHWGYGAAWGMIYGVMQSSIHLPHLLHGTLFGGIIAVVASTLVPAMRIAPPPQDQPMSKNVMMTIINLLYGWVVALTFRALSKDA